jgi:predicted  nucleic acid-binding Zn-ribbon protein
MLAELERLIQLQQTDTSIESTRRRVLEHPYLVQGLDDRLTTANDGVATAKKNLADNQEHRRNTERDLAAVQSRLSKYKNQLMEVKSNREYQAMQKEMEVAQHDIQQLEDRELELMVAADDLVAKVKEAEKALAADKAVIADERKRLEQETQRLEAQLKEAEARRDSLRAQVPATLLATYDRLYGIRQGQPLAEARAELCTACHVRIRPQVFNELRRNDQIRQCDSCARIFYYVAPAPSADAPAEPVK